MLLPGLCWTVRALQQRPSISDPTDSYMRTYASVLIFRSRICVRAGSMPLCSSAVAITTSHCCRVICAMRTSQRFAGRLSAAGAARHLLQSSDVAPYFSPDAQKRILWVELSAARFPASVFYLECQPITLGGGILAFDWLGKAIVPDGCRLGFEFQINGVWCPADFSPRSPPFSTRRRDATVPHRLLRHRLVDAGDLLDGDAMQSVRAAQDRHAPLRQASRSRQCHRAARERGAQGQQMGRRPSHHRGEVAGRRYQHSQNL